MEECNNILHNADLQAVISALGRMRAQHQNRPLHQPSITVNELDHALVHNTQHRDTLEKLGYHLGRQHYGKILREEAVLMPASSNAQPNLGGRPSLVQNADSVALVQKALDTHTKESERIVVIGRGAKRRMVVAKHLVKTKHRLWCENAALHSAMSWASFHRIMKLHFPYVRNPRRNTDVCKHCKVFTKELLPRALKCMKRNREHLESICARYFANLDSQVRQANQPQDDVKYLEKFQLYVAQKERDSRQDPLRTDMSRSSRIALHAAEAQCLHTLKPHVELCLAYEWHRLSARRQGDFVKNLREGGLPRSTALLQVDFKENVKYPMSPDETSEEWHAQNKLSLTVFGANALLPKTPVLCPSNFFQPCLLVGFLEIVLFVCLSLAGCRAAQDWRRLFGDLHSPRHRNFGSRLPSRKTDD